MSDSLPPSVRVSPTTVDVSVLTPDGATVEIILQRPRGRALTDDEVVAQAQQLALSALEAAAASLTH